LSIDFAGDMAIVFCRFGVRVNASFSDPFLLEIEDEVVNLEFWTGERLVFSFSSLGLASGRKGDDSGEWTKTLRKARYAKTCAGVGAASILVSSMLAYHTVSAMLDYTVVEM